MLAAAAPIEASGRGGDVEVKAPKSIKAASCGSTSRTRATARANAQLIRVVGDHSPQEFLEVVQSEGGPIPEWIEDGGGVGTTAPGQTGWATQNLAEGRYFVVAMPEGEARPATAELRVEGGSPGELPEAPGEIVARDYTFDAKGLKFGKNTIVVKNDGRQLHHVVGAPIRPGKTIDDVRKYAAQERPSGEPPLDQRSGFNTAVIDGGIEQVTEIDLKKPGKYALLCFIQDRNGGPPHVMKGMIKEVEVQ